MTENDLIALHEAWYAADDAHRNAAGVCYDLAVAEAAPDVRAAARAQRETAEDAERAASIAWFDARDARCVYRGYRKA